MFVVSDGAELCLAFKFGIEIGSGAIAAGDFEGGGEGDGGGRDGNR